MPAGTRRQRRRSAYSHSDHAGRAKIGWVVPGPALAAARRLSRAEGWPVDVYTCRGCGCYHLGRGNDSPEVPQRVARCWPDGLVLGELLPV